MTGSIRHGWIRSLAVATYRWPLVLLLASAPPGCATHLCQSDMDHYYAAYGGLRARADMLHGRVGSIFDPAVEVRGDHMGAVDSEPWGKSSPSIEEAPLPRPATFQAPEESVGPELISPASGQVVVALGPPDSN
jgi:hypothetical protein